MSEPLFTLTTTELAVLGAAHHRLLDPGAHGGARCDDPAQAQAVDSLRARGLLDERGRLNEDDPAGLLVAGVLDLRLAAHRSLVLRRVLGASADRDEAAEMTSARILHVVPDLMTCLEDVHHTGLHTFAFLEEVAQQIEAVTDFLVPPEAGARPDASPENVTWSPALTISELKDRLQHPTVLAEVCDLTLVDGREQVGGQHLLALGPGGCFVASRPDRGPETAGLAFTRVEPGWVRQWATAVLCTQQREGGSHPCDGAQ